MHRGAGPRAPLLAALTLVLAACTPTSERVAAALDQPSVLAAQGWSMTGSLASGRLGPTATLLPNGKVLVAGGQGPDDYLLVAELYDPATGAWAPTGSLAQTRQDATATVLPSGKVLIVGGHVGGAPRASAELYDPATGTWSSTGSLSTGRGNHAVTLLPTGKVLVLGGQGSTTLTHRQCRAV